MKEREKGDPMSILVIGWMGFIGSRIVRSMIELGEEVVVVGRQPTLHRLGEVAEARYHGKPIYYIDQIDNGRIVNDLGFKLKYDLAAGVKEQVSRQRALNKPKGKERV
jgi:nucleoside-diphosphate-sugar epimerase